MNISGDSIGFNQFKDPVDDVGDDIFTMSVEGRVRNDYSKRATTIDTTYGNGYYQIQSSYGNYAGNDQTNLSTIQPDIIIPTGCQLIEYSALWSIGTTTATDLQIDVLGLEYSGATRTVTLITDARSTITGMSSTSLNYSINKTLSTPYDFDKGDGILPVFQNFVAKGFQALFLGMSLEFKFKRVH